ncbi:hypothetical protein FSP39_011461, partial [Pinctada imbricata]
NINSWADMADASIPEREKDVYTKQRMVEFYQHIVTGHTRTPPWTDHYATCPGCDTVDDYLVLKSFSEWAWMYLQKIIRHDHAALFTGYKSLQIQLIEEKRNALSVHVAAHELGHNFGARHDGKTGAESCSADDKYLMASKMSRVDNPVMAGNPWSFSSCSRSSIHGYIENLIRDLTLSTVKDNEMGFCIILNSVCLVLPPSRLECDMLRVSLLESPELRMSTDLSSRRHSVFKPKETCPFGNDPVYNCSVQDCIIGSFTHPLCCQFCKQYITSSSTSVTSSLPSTTAVSRDSETSTVTKHEEGHTNGLTSVCPCAGNEKSSTASTPQQFEKTSTASSTAHSGASSELPTESTTSAQQEMSSSSATTLTSNTPFSDLTSRITTYIPSTSETLKSSTTVVSTTQHPISTTTDMKTTPGLQMRTREYHSTLSTIYTASSTSKPEITSTGIKNYEFTSQSDNRKDIESFPSERPS